MRVVQVLLFAIATAILTGCATPTREYDITIDGLASAAATTKKTFMILPVNREVSFGDLQFQEFASIVTRALEARGFKSVLSHKDKIREWNVAITLAYGINEFKHFYSYSGIKGVSGMSGSYSTFTDYVSLKAFDVETNAVLWNTTISNYDSRIDLRRSFPIMVAAGLPYLATNTHQELGVKIKEDDPRILYLKGQPAPEKAN